RHEDRVGPGVTLGAPVATGGILGVHAPFHQMIAAGGDGGRAAAALDACGTSRRSLGRLRGYEQQIEIRVAGAERTGGLTGMLPCRSVSGRRAPHAEEGESGSEWHGARPSGEVTTIGCLLEHAWGASCSIALALTFGRSARRWALCRGSTARPRRDG